MAELTAAEKAEARRLKILAKKNARMKYAAGDRSQLPSVAPAEPIPAPTVTPQQNTSENSSAARQGSSQATASRTNPGSSSLLNQSNLHNTKPKPWRTFSSPFTSERFRLFVLVMLAIALALAVKLEYLNGWKVSAPQLFASIELCFFAPVMIEKLQRRLMLRNRVSEGAGMGGMGVLDIIFNVTRAASVAKQMFREFSLFMISFLCTWYWVAKA